MDQNNSTQHSDRVLAKKPAKSRRIKVPRVRVSSPAPILVLIIIICLALFGYSFYQYYDARKNPNEKAAKIQVDNANNVAAQVGQHFDLPTDEEPSVTEVKDAAKLKAEPFFIDAENNDIVLVYRKARQVILWRPSIKQVIKSGPLVGEIPNETQPSVTPKKVEGN